MNHTASQMHAVPIRSRWRARRPCSSRSWASPRPSPRRSAPPARPARPRRRAQSHVTVTPSSTPAYAGDAGDPDPLYSSGKYYAFTTGTPAGNYIQALTSNNPSSGFVPYNGASGSSALPNPPSWETVDSQTSPGVFFYGGHWVMFYDASSSGPEDSGHSCISVATASTLNPPVFSDTSTGPMYCGSPGVGVLDPSPFVDPATGTAYLVWKTNDGGGSQAASQIETAPLNGSGTGFVGAAPTVLLTVDQPQLPWETTTDDPQMVSAYGSYDLLFSGGNFTSMSYNEAMATCARDRSGPCVQPAAPFLTSYGSAYGPGGGSLFQDSSGNWWLGYAAWNAPCTNYGGSCNALRYMYTTPIDLSNGLVVPCSAPNDPFGYRFVATDGGVFTYGNQPFCGSTGGIHINQPVVGIANTPDSGGYWTVARDGGIFSFGDAKFFGSTGGIAPERTDRGYGGHSEWGGLLACCIGRGDLLLWQCAVLRFDRFDPPEPADRRHGVDARREGLLAGRLRWRHFLLR